MDVLETQNGEATAGTEVTVRDLSGLEHSGTIAIKHSCWQLTEIKCKHGLQRKKPDEWIFTGQGYRVTHPKGCDTCNYNERNVGESPDTFFCKKGFHSKNFQFWANRNRLGITNRLCHHRNQQS